MKSCASLKATCPFRKHFTPLKQRVDNHVGEWSLEMMTQWMEDCLFMCILCLLIEPNSHARTLTVTYGWALDLSAILPSIAEM